MSIIIKGAEMPECCAECNNEIHCSHCFDEEFKKDGREDDCPLVELPDKHGRLIDADYYISQLEEQTNTYYRLLRPETIERINRTIEDLKNFPAIIEAERNEKNEQAE